MHHQRWATGAVGHLCCEAGVGRSVRVLVSATPPGTISSPESSAAHPTLGGDSDGEPIGAMFAHFRCFDDVLDFPFSPGRGPGVVRWTFRRLERVQACPGIQNSVVVSYFRIIYLGFVSPGSIHHHRWATGAGDFFADFEWLLVYTTFPVETRHVRMHRKPGQWRMPQSL